MAEADRLFIMSLVVDGRLKTDAKVLMLIMMKYGRLPILYTLPFQKVRSREGRQDK